MKYCLAIYKNGEYTEVNNISNALGKEEKSKSYNLKEIIDFTNSFDNEDDLKLELYQMGLISEEFVSGKPQINYYKNKDALPTILQYGVSYKNDAKYFDLEYLKNYYSTKITDINFLRAFLDKFYPYLITIPVFENTLNNLNNCFYEYSETNNYPDYLHEAIIEFINIYCIRKNTKGIKYTDFTRVRQLAMFAVNYNHNTKKQKDKINTSLITDEIEQYETLINDSYDEKETKSYKDKLLELKTKLEQYKLLNNKEKEPSGKSR